jgi:ABC-type sugar transport system permease subunit
MLWLGFPGDLIIWGGTFARIPTEVLESGKIDGTSWWTEFTKIVVPLVWPTVALQMVLIGCSLFSASGNVFLLTQGQYGTMTLSAWMYVQLLYNSGTSYTSNAYNYMSAVGLMLTTVAIILSLTIRKFTDKVFGEVEY